VLKPEVGGGCDLPVTGRRPSQKVKVLKPLLGGFLNGRLQGRRPSQKVKVLKPLKAGVEVLPAEHLSQTFPEGKGVETRDVCAGRRPDSGRRPSQKVKVLKRADLPRF